MILRSNWKSDGGKLTLGESTLLFKSLEDPDMAISCMAMEILDGNALEDDLRIDGWRIVAAGTYEQGELPNLPVMDVGAVSLSPADATVTIDERSRQFEAIGRSEIAPWLGETFIIRVPNQTPRRGDFLLPRVVGPRGPPTPVGPQPRSR